MTYFGINIVDFSWTCLRDFDFTSLCSQTSIIDILKLFFMGVFYTSLLISFIRGSSACGSNRKNWVVLVVSICCALISVAHFSKGLRLRNQQSWLGCIFRAFVWLSFTVSLHVQRNKWIKILNSIWWTSSCVLASALNIEIMLKEYTIELFEILQWLVHFLLLFCSFQNLGYFVTSQTKPEDTASLSEPLIAQKVETTQTQLGRATLLSKLTFSWVNSLLRLGYSKPLALVDIPFLLPEDEANLAYEAFMHAWESLVRETSNNNNKNLVLWSVARTFSKENILIAFYALLRSICLIISPLILYAFVNYTNTTEGDLKQGFSILGFMVLSKVVESLCQRHCGFGSRRSGMKIRSALMVAVYQKLLKLSSSARTRHSTGEVVNYIAVDAYRLGEFPWWFHIAWTSAVQLVLSIIILFSVVGAGALPGLVPLLICGLLNLPFAKIIHSCQSQFMMAQDERLRSTSEILHSMKIIKLQSWEDKFKNLVLSLRAKEFKWLTKIQIIKASGSFLYWMNSIVVSTVVFLGCALFKSAPLNAGTIFTVITTLRMMAEPVRMIPEALSIMIQVKVSFDRLNTFLLDEELTSVNGYGRNIKQSSVNAVEIQEGNFTWDHESVSPTLREVKLEIKWGQKIAVCGPVGAGKSSLLYAVLGEIPMISGTELLIKQIRFFVKPNSLITFVYNTFFSLKFHNNGKQVNVGGTIAYVSQTSWIQSGTVRDNILFGKPMIKTRYENATKVCALDMDINDFSHGDLTEIGQRGINMSGGQRQRIQLARAVYNDADIYLLDDPFSAVDAQTAAILFHDCVMTALREKTVILVTHQVEFLTEVDTILVMEDGKVTQSGSYEDLQSAGTAFEQLVSAHKAALTGLDKKYENSSDSGIEFLVHPEEYQSFNLTQNQSEQVISTKGQLGAQLTQEEEKVTGDVGWKQFWEYISFSRSSFLFCLTMLAEFAFLALQTASSYWLALAFEIPKVTSGILIGVFASFSFLSAIFIYIRSFLAAHLGLKASEAFFSSFTSAIFNAPMLFFDSTPVGRILTRASSDLSILDIDIPYSLTMVSFIAAEILVIICVIVSITWQVLIVAVPATVASIYIQGYYQASSRELMRINGTTKAPVMNFAAETSLGVVTIRALNMVNRFFNNYLKLVDMDAAVFFHVNVATEWSILRIEILQNLTVFTAAALLILLPRGSVSSGLVGLSLSYALTLKESQVFWSRMYSMLSDHIISAERIKQFIHIPSEPPAIVEDNRPSSSWPSKGRIDLRALEIRYRPNAQLVLKGINCTFLEGSKVGVVGRTGSGKTTLISALFRLVEPSRGDILIDGINICLMGLKDLRTKLSIIPQEPTLFKGSIRTNLDPLGFYEDDEIWKALEKCQLKDTVGKLPGLLDSSVSDEGGNWSLGQRQLFCLGRVLLKRNRILVLDEATASIDSATDAILQQVIRQEFAECTVITVAHRVPTVIDSDMVMVLSYGKLVEYDEPSKLMGTNSWFSNLVAEYWSSCRKNSSPISIMKMECK